MRPDSAAVASHSVPPDTLLVHRIAALGDKAALAALHARHGLTLYALAYSVVLDSEAADAAVALAFRELWIRAASFDVRENSVGRWLARITRRAAEHSLVAPSVRAAASLALAFLAH